MRDLISIIEGFDLFENTDSVPPQVFDLVYNLNSEDVGSEPLEGFGFKGHDLYFEGFSEICWNDYEQRLHSSGDRSLSNISDIEAEILADWTKRSGGYIIDHGWTDDPIPYEPTVFWAVIRRPI